MTTLGIAAFSPEQIVSKLAQDMYFGDGEEHPPITVRVDRLERLARGLSKVFYGMMLSTTATVIDIAVHAHRW